MTADTALHLALYFGMSAEFRMNLPSAYEMVLARRESRKAIERIRSRVGQPAGPRSAA